MYQQASAEGITERLSGLFQSPIETLSKSPIEFVNYIRVTKKVCSFMQSGHLIYVYCSTLPIL